MNENQKSSSTQTRWRRIFDISGILAIVLAAIWVAVSVMGSTLYKSGQPNTAIGYLQLFSHNQTLAASTWSLWIVADALLIPITIALYFALKHVNRTLAIAGAVFTLAFCIYDPLITELQSLRLVAFSQAYVSAVTEGAKSSIITNAAGIVNAMPVMTFLSFFVGSVGALLFSIAMIRSTFRKGTGAFGIVSNMVAIIGSLYPVLPNSPGLVGLFFVISVPLVAIWFILVGAQLLRNNRFAAPVVFQSAAGSYQNAVTKREETN